VEIEQKILTIIEQNSHIPIDQLMEIALSSQDSSYYKTQQVIGSNYDFITAPEISQMFGEIISIWSILQWQKLGQKAFNLVELGAGTGTLMLDLLRCASRVCPNFIDSICQITILEINPYFIALQRNKLAKFNIPIKHITSINELEENTSIIIANEFFDALPIKQYKKITSKWHEIVVKYKCKLYFDINHEPTNLFRQHINASQGAIIETCPQSIAIVLHICNIIKKYCGSALIIDYGYNHLARQRKPNQYNSTLQAMKNHLFHPVLTNIGNTDLTAHVDFAAITTSILQSGIQNVNFTNQSEFLHHYGIKQRLTQMIKQNRHLTNNLINQYKYLSHKMGFLFKVLDFAKIC